MYYICRLNEDIMEKLEDKIKNRLVYLNSRLNRLMDPGFIWIKPTVGKSLNDEIIECKVQIKELEELLITK